ncbi:MAG: metal-binding protein [Betaproteobacteria bacterium]|nr:metal-binding protein [Betaproteobacteria bacterium]
MLKRLVLILALLIVKAAAAQSLPVIEVYMPTVCLACIEWADHLRQNGFTVKVTQTDDMEAVKRRLKVPKDLEAVPSATVAGYFIEGHVHADQIKELLAEKPKALGLAVPGLPLGAPGREYSSPTCETACTILDKDSEAAPRVRREFYETLLVRKDGKTSVYARH